MNVRPPIAPLRTAQQDLDADDLNSLSTFHFVGAGLAFLAVLFLLAHFASLYRMLNDPTLLKIQRQYPPSPESVQMLKTMIWLRVIMGLLLVASVILNILSGACLRARKYRTFSLVVAGLNCLQVPLGTLLGVFTFVVLDRQSVRELYRR